MNSKTLNKVVTKMTTRSGSGALPDPADLSISSQPPTPPKSSVVASGDRNKTMVLVNSPSVRQH